MTANIELAGFGPVHRMKFTQGSTEIAGRCVADCSVGSPESVEDIGQPHPRTTSLQASSEGWFAKWPDMYVRKVVRARKGYLQVILEDSRWILDKYTMNRNHNERDSAGDLKDDSSKTVKELVEEIVSAVSGKLTIVVGQVPSYYPPAKWAGKTCKQAMKELLEYTGCRLVYRPESEDYYFTFAGSGATPAFAEEMYKPAPPNNLRAVRFVTAPTLYESRESAIAVTINETTGAADAIAAGTALDTAPATSASAKTQHHYRLWKPNTSEGRLYVSHRVKSQLIDPHDPQFEKGRVIRDQWEPFPVHQPMVDGGTEIVGLIELTSGGNVFVTNHPVLSADGNNYSVTATVLTGHHRYAESTGLVREEKVIEIDSQATDELIVHLDWIKPIQSSEPDVPASQWDSVLNGVAQALSRQYRPPGRVGTIEIPRFYQLNGSGQVGCVQYELQAHRIYKKHFMRVALNFTPGNEWVFE